LDDRRSTWPQCFNDAILSGILRLTRYRGSFELHGAAALGVPRHVITENLAPQYLYWIGRNQHGNIIPNSSGEFEQRYVLAD
jgi:hypothetical protein